MDEFTRFKVLLKRLTTRGGALVVLEEGVGKEVWLPVKNVHWNKERSELRPGQKVRVTIPRWLMLKIEELREARSKQL